MPVTEIATLQILAPFTVTSREIEEFFQKASQLQSRWSSYPLYYFVSTSSPDMFYLISGWKDVEAHYEWIKSDENQGLLKVADTEGFLAVKGLVHLGIDFEEMSKLGLGSEDGVLVFGKGINVEKAKWIRKGRDMESESDQEYSLITLREDDLDADQVTDAEVLKRIRWASEF